MKSEKELRVLEKEVYNVQSQINSKTKVILFIPDHLEFDCNTGVKIIQVKTENMMSTMVVH